MQNESYFSQVKPVIFGFFNMIPVLFLGSIVIYTGIWVTAESFSFWHYTVGYGFYHALVTASASELLSLAVIGYWKPPSGTGKTIRGIMIIAAFCFIVIPASFKSVESFAGKLHFSPSDKARYEILSGKIDQLKTDMKHYKEEGWNPAYNRVEKELRAAEKNMEDFLTGAKPDNGLVRQEKTLVLTCFGIRILAQLLNWIMFHVLVAGFLSPFFNWIKERSKEAKGFESVDPNGSNDCQILSNQDVKYLQNQTDFDIHDSRESIVLKVIETKGGEASFRAIGASKKLSGVEEYRMILNRLIHSGKVEILNPAAKDWDQIYAVPTRIRRVK